MELNKYFMKYREKEAAEPFLKNPESVLILHALAVTNEVIFNNKTKYTRWQLVLNILWVSAPTLHTYYIVIASTLH